MELNIDGKFEGKMTFAFKNTMRNLGNFHQSTWKSQNLDFDGILLSKVENVWAYNLQGLIYYDSEKRCKIGRGIDLSFQDWDEDSLEFWPEHSKISKICILMGCLWSKYIMFELKKYRGVMFDGNEY